MLIGICGGICSGKKTVAQYLVEHHDFKLLRLEIPSGSSPRNETPAFHPPRSETPPVHLPRSGTPVYNIRNGTPFYNPESEPVLDLDPEVAYSTSGDTDAQLQSNKSKKKKKSQMVCYNCNKKGHLGQECRYPSQESAITINGTQSIAVRDSNPPSTSSFFQQPSSELSFASAEALLDYVTVRWQSRFVTTDVHDEGILDILSRRPFFMLVSVDSPLTVRHARFRALHNPHCTIESFALASDTHLYDPQEGLQPLISRATVRLLNTSSSLAHLYATLGKINLADPGRLRPSWDAYFMSLATLASRRSNCMKRRVGAVLVGREKRVISTGYNGTALGLKNCSEGGCSRCNSGNSSGVGLATCLCLHAEENALLEAGRERIREGSVLYCDTCPCLTCSIKICQVGIGEVVYAHGYSMDADTAAVFSQAGVKLRQYIPPPNGLIHLENLERMDHY